MRRVTKAPRIQPRANTADIVIHKRGSITALSHCRLLPAPSAAFQYQDCGDETSWQYPNEYETTPNRVSPWVFRILVTLEHHRVRS